MCPTRLASYHPVAEEILKYALGGFPTNTGKPWTLEDMEAAIEQGLHVSELVPTAMEQLESRIESKVIQGQAKVVLWDDINVNLPKHLKVSPIAMISHKSRLFR